MIRDRNHRIDIINTIKPPFQASDFLIEENENLYIFFSVDICNSTQLKKNTTNWFQANKTLYAERFADMHFWKYNGDEVLYAEPYSTIENLIDILSNAYLYLKSMQKQIQNQLKADAKDFFEFQLKGTFWIARTSGRKSSRTDEDELSTSIVESNLHIIDNVANEFLGANIDEGFRIAKKISGSKIVVDSKVVYILLLINDIAKFSGLFTLCQESDPFFKFSRTFDINIVKKIENILENLYFINFTHLKGIWKNRAYPIFWFYENESDSQYDDKLDDNFITPEKIDISIWCKKIEQIYRQANEEKEFIEILRIIAENKPSKIYKLDKDAKLYYSVACINPKTNNVLIIKRSNKRHHLRGVWEFFSCKHISAAVVNSIEERFSQEFGIQIKVLTDGENSQNLLPIHFCTIHRNGYAHNSILCAARIDNDCELNDDELLNIIRRSEANINYSDFRFVNIGEAGNYKEISFDKIELDSYLSITNQRDDALNLFEDNSVVMYFEESLRAVKKVYERSQDGYAWYE